MTDGPPAAPAFYRRPLKASEKRLVRVRARHLRAAADRAARLALPLTGGVVMLLWLLTLLASDSPWIVITLFWLVVGVLIALWTRHGLKRDAADRLAMAAALDSAARHDRVEVCDVSAECYARLEEVEDEGPCYAFQLPNDRVLFVTGQEFHERAAFPSLDFSLVYLLDERDRTIGMWIEKRGRRARPLRSIARGDRMRLETPTHLEVRTGRVGEIERILTASADP